MLNIEVFAVAQDARSRDKVGRVLFDAMKEQMSATPWAMTVHYRKALAFKDDSVAKFTNEGRVR